MSTKKISEPTRKTLLTTMWLAEIYKLACSSGRVEIQVGSTTLSLGDGLLGTLLIVGGTSMSMDPLDGFLTVEQSGSLL